VFWSRKTKKEYFENGVLKTEASFRGSRRDGVTKRYYENGFLMIEANFRNGEPHGTFREYYENNNMMAEEVYNSGQLIIQKRFDRNGKLNDVARRYYQNGQIRIEAGFREGKPEGITREYHENGSLMAEEYYRNGTLISNKGYDKSGTLMVSLKEFYDNGHMRNETDFTEGIYKEYYKSGAIKIDARFKDKKPHGLIKEYYEEGIIAAEDGYEHGRHVGSRRYSRLGSLVASSGKLKEAEPVVFEAKKEEGNMFKEYIDKLGQMPGEEKKTQVLPIVQETTVEPAPQKVPAAGFDALREALVGEEKKNDRNIQEKQNDKKIDFVRKEIEKALEGKLENEIEEVGREPQVEEKGDVKTVKEYYLSGALKTEKTYKGDKLHGLTKEHYESGELMAELFYTNGELDSQVRFDKTGRFFYKWKR